MSVILVPKCLGHFKLTDCIWGFLVLRFDFSECHWGEVFLFWKLFAGRYVLLQIHFFKTNNASFGSLRIFLDMATKVNISYSCDYDITFIYMYILLSDFDVGRCSAIYVSDSLQDVESIQLRELHSCWNIASPQSNTWTQIQFFYYDLLFAIMDAE